MIELHGRHPAPLRGWVYIADVPAASVAVSPSGRVILGLGSGASVIVRALPTASRVG